MLVNVAVPSDPLYVGAAEMIRKTFAREYNAVVEELPNRLIVVQSEDGVLRCAGGCRDEMSGFFSQQYLDLPVHEAIARRTSCAVSPHEILELTSLAAARPGAMAALLRGFADLGLDAGYRWGLFTATARLRKMARRLGIDLIELCEARREKVSNPDAWGSYYDHRPWVCAVDGLPARRSLESSLLSICGREGVGA